MSTTSSLRPDEAYRAGFAAEPGASNPYDGLSEVTRERVCSKQWFLGARARARADILRSQSYRDWLAARSAADADGGAGDGV